MSDHAARLSDTMQRIRSVANIQPRAADVCVLVAPPLSRARGWAAFHLPAAWLRAAGWECDFLARQHHHLRSHCEYERVIGSRSRAAYQRLVRSGARVTRRVRRRDVEQAVLDPSMRAIVLIGHHVNDGIELLDGVIPAHALIALLEQRNASGPFPFAWLVCSSDDWTRAVVLIAPDVLPFSAPIPLVLPAAIETCAAWVEELNGATPFDVAQQRAMARRFPASDRPDRPEERY